MKTSQASRRAPLDCRLVSVLGGAAHEFVAYSESDATLRPAGWPCFPGDVRRAMDGTPLLLHFAPGRWFAPTAHADALTAMDAAVEAGSGVRIAVEGKWRPLCLRGPDARRALSSTLDIAATLQDRECGATTLFDCPALVMSEADGYALWILASYTEDFIAAVERLRGEPAR